MTGNDWEMAVLAGATAIRVIENGGAKAVVVAMAIESARFAGWKPAFNDIASAASRGERTLAMAARAPTEPPSAPSHQLIRKNSETLQALVKAGTGTDPASVAQLAGSVAAVLSSVANSTRYSTSIGRWAQQTVSAAAEEINVLWWVMGGTSIDLDRRWAEVSPPSRPIVAGKELAGLTVELPGLVAHPALLAEVIRAGGEAPPTITAEDAIGKLEQAWKSTNANGSSGLDDLTPIIMGIRRSTELGPGWTAQKEPLNYERRVSALGLAAQTYREFLFLRAVDRASSA